VAAIVRELRESSQTVKEKSERASPPALQTTVSSFSIMT
jgi:hypothetical protein